MDENQQYEHIKEQFDKASQEEQDAAKDYLNKIADCFGDDFYHSRQLAYIIWTDITEEEKIKIASCIQDNMTASDFEGAESYKMQTEEQK